MNSQQWSSAIGHQDQRRARQPILGVLKIQINNFNHPAIWSFSTPSFTILLKGPWTGEGNDITIIKKIMRMCTKIPFSQKPHFHCQRNELRDKEG